MATPAVRPYTSLLLGFRHRPAKETHRFTGRRAIPEGNKYALIPVPDAPVPGTILSSQCAVPIGEGNGSARHPGSFAGCIREGAEGGIGTGKGQR